MKRIMILILLLPFVLVTRSYGSDIETRLEALEEIIKVQQKTIEKQQQEIDELKGQSKGIQVAQEVKPVVTEAAPKEVVGPAKSKELGMAYPISPIDKKYSEIPKPLEVVSFSQSKFVPDISFILDGSYLARNLKDEAVTNLKVPELIPAGELNQKRGFNLNVGELSLYSPIDPYFELTATIPFTEDGVDLEEAYFSTRSLPWGFQVKGGKFRSSFGRLNVQHEHVWDFADAPLVNRSFFGEEALIEKGLQINWVAPTPFYLLLGAELLQGENTASFGTASIGLEKSGLVFAKEGATQPNLLVSYIKSSVDIGNLSLLGGLSYAQGETRQNGTNGSPAQLAFGDTKIYGIDLTAKYFIDSYRYVSWQNEFMHRQTNLDVGTDPAADDPDQPLSLFGKELRQSGFYSQLVYRFARQWRLGVRYDRLTKNDVTINGESQGLPGGLDRISAMLEFRPTEFSTLRFQFNRDNSLFDGNNVREPVNSVFLQFTMAIGAHGAHAF